jgi:hypothetical protein
VYSVLGIELNNAAVFLRPTVAELADEIAGLIGSSSGGSR